MRITELLNQQPLLYSAYLYEDILREEELIESILDSAKSFLGSNFNKTVDDIKGGITDLTNAGILIKDSLSCAPVFDTVVFVLSKKLNSEISTFRNTGNNLPPQTRGIFTSFKNFVTTAIQKVTQFTGTVQFFGKLGLYAILKYINTFLADPINIKETLLNTLQDKISELVGGVLKNISLPGFMTFFNTLKTVKTYFLDVLTEIKKKIDSVPPNFRPQAKCANLNSEIKKVAEMSVRYSKNILNEGNFEIISDASPIMLSKLSIKESLDAPYPIQVGPSPYEHDVNHYTAKTIMPNGKELQVNFIPVTQSEKKYYVDFWVDGTQHLTGKGDQQRIFATVLSAIRQFIEANSPDMLKFSAMKNKRYDDTRPMSRVNLYNKLVKKYAQSVGYNVSQRETENQVNYTLIKKDDLNEVNIDNEKGWGEVPLNRSVDYHGLRVKMRPSVFLRLAAPLGEEGPSVKAITQHIASGGTIAAPFLDISIPAEWEEEDFSKAASVAGHEGRNRMTAVLAAEGDEAIEVHLIPRHGYRNRHITADWIKNMRSGMYAEHTKTFIPGPLFNIWK